jgi:Endonuclease/Exonuclease/phosphatase family
MRVRSEVSGTALISFALFVATAGCTSSGGGAASPASPTPAAVVTTLTVGQFNTDISDEYPRIDDAKVAEAVKDSGAEVVGIEEGGAAIPKLAKDLGWSYYDVRMQIVSRLPLIDPPDGNGVYTFVEVSPGHVVAMENVHLPSSPYGPYWVRDGKTAQQVVAMEKRTRLPSILPQLAAAKTLQQQGIPVFLTGDFNSPSFLDWTSATVGTQKYMRFPVRWPVTAAVVADGFHDSYRTVYPDPVKDPGLTWPVHRPIAGWNPTPRDPHDRIDFIFATAPATPTASIIVGETGGPQLSAIVTPWQSDHRDIASTFTVTGVTPPTLVSMASRLITVGDPAVAAYHAPSGGSVQVGLAPQGGGSFTSIGTQGVSGTDGTLTFDTGSWTPGAYEARLVDASGNLASTYPFWVEAPGTVPTIAVSQPSYRTGQPILVSWQNAPGERWDWVAVYTRDADPNVASYLTWAYTKSTVDGSMTLDKTSFGPWPLKPGKYSVYLLKDDLYVKVAAVSFTITP